MRSSYGYGDTSSNLPTGFPPMDLVIPPANFLTVRIVHAAVMSTAVLFFFPFGGIVIRVLRHRHIVWIHAALQMIGWTVYVAGAGMGIYLAKSINQVRVWMASPPWLQASSSHAHLLGPLLTTPSLAARLPSDHRPRHPSPPHLATVLRDSQPLPLPAISADRLSGLSTPMARTRSHHGCHCQRRPWLCLH